MSNQTMLKTRNGRSILNLKVINFRNDELKHFYLISAAILTFFPFWLMFVVSFKTLPQFYQNVLSLDFPLHFANYSVAYKIVSKYILNSIIVAVATVGGVVFVSSLSAYAFSRYKFYGQKFLFFIIISLLMVPSILTMVPAFVLVKNLGLINSFWGIILPGIAGLQVFAIYLLRNFMASLPEELFEAARMDGAGIWRCYWHIALPLSKPALSVVVISSLLNNWNDFVWPLLVISDDSYRTIPIGLAFFRTQYQTDYGPLMAGYVISILPLLIAFIFISRELVRGLNEGAVKL